MIQTSKYVAARYCGCSDLLLLIFVLLLLLQVDATAVTASATDGRHDGGHHKRRRGGALTASILFFSSSPHHPSAATFCSKKMKLRFGPSTTAKLEYTRVPSSFSNSTSERLTIAQKAAAMC
jgi:hypothetical protein